MAPGPTAAGNTPAPGARVQVTAQPSASADRPNRLNGDVPRRSCAATVLPGLVTDWPSAIDKDVAQETISGLQTIVIRGGGDLATWWDMRRHIGLAGWVRAAWVWKWAGGFWKPAVILLFSTVP